MEFNLEINDVEDISCTSNVDNQELKFNKYTLVQYNNSIIAICGKGYTGNNNKKFVFSYNEQNKLEYKIEALPSLNERREFHNSFIIEDILFVCFGSDKSIELYL